MKLPKLTPANPEAVKNFFSPVSWGVRDMPRFLELMKSVLEQVSPGYHLADNLLTWGRNNSMFEDGEFVKAWEANIGGNPVNSAIVWRRYILACAGYHCVQLEGDFVECGCYTADGVKTVVDYLGGTEFPKTFWGYDLFEHTESDPHHSMPEHGQDLFNKVKAKFAAYPQVRIIQGRIPEVFAGQSPERIAYLHIDLNQLGAELGALDALFGRVVPSGVIILDDYEWAMSYRIQKIGEDPWFEARGYRVFPLPTGQGLVIKR